jgi:uncharacterized protein (DUF2147 family)
MKKAVAIFFLATVLAAWTGVPVMAQTHKTDDIVGVWLNQEGTAKVQVFRVSSNYYGKIVWLETPNDSITGKPRTDDKNPDTKLQSAPLLGLVNLKGFVFNGEDEWKDGTIYDPKNGKTYSCYIRFESADVLKIRGYIGVSLLGRTTLWTRSSN